MVPVKQVRISITTTVIDECEGRTDGAECQGGDHHGVEITVMTGVGDVPPDQVDEAIMHLVASGGAELIRRLEAKAPWMLTGDGKPPEGFVPPEESVEGAPSADELAALFGDPEAAPRNFEELAELMARNDVGMVEISDLEEMAPLRDALRRAFEKDPDRA